jgi:hypothetical protein
MTWLNAVLASACAGGGVAGVAAEALAVRMAGPEMEKAGVGVGAEEADGAPGCRGALPGWAAITFAAAMAESRGSQAEVAVADAATVKGVSS